MLAIPVTRTKWILVWLIWLIGVGAAMQFAKISVTFDGLQNHYTSSQLFLAALLSSVGVMGIILGGAASIVINQIGVKRALIGSTLLGFLMSAFQAFLPSMELFIFFRILEGLSHLAIVVAAPVAILSICSDSDKPIAMGIWATFFGVAYAVTNVVAPVLINSFGLKSIYIAHSLFLAVLMLAYIGFSRDIIKPNSDYVKIRLRDIVQRHIHIYSSLKVMLPALCFFWHALTFVVILTFLPGLAEDDFISLVLSILFPILTVLGSISGGYLCRQFKAPKQVILTTLIIYILVALCAQATIGHALFPIISSVMMFVAGVLPGTIFASMSQLQLNITEQSYASGAICQLGNLGSVLGAPLFVVILVFFPNGTLIQMIILMSFLGLISSFFLFWLLGKHTIKRTSK